MFAKVLTIHVMNPANTGAPPPLPNNPTPKKKANGIQNGVWLAIGVLILAIVFLAGAVAMFISKAQNFEIS